MKILTRRLTYTHDSQCFTVVPLGDLHIGSAACDEHALRETIARIKATPRCYWVGMGDYCDFINRTDKRFNARNLPKWLSLHDIDDLAAAQRQHFLDLIAPIAHKCLALVEGNHETKIAEQYERNIFSEIVSGVKTLGKFPAEYPLAIGYNGWLVLRFLRANTNTRCSIKLTLNHGAFGTVPQLEKWLWQHDCDIALFGHVHQTRIARVTVQSLTTGDAMVETDRVGAICGTFLRTNGDGYDTYAERRANLSVPTGAIAVEIRPANRVTTTRIRIAERF